MGLEGEEHVRVGPGRDAGVWEVRLDRPRVGNALDIGLFRALPGVLARLDADPEVRCVVLSGEGRHFCTGIDVGALGSLMGAQTECQGRQREETRRFILMLQDANTAIERCRKPVVAAVHGACIGAGVDLITACDIVYAAADAQFCVKEVDLGITADVGTLQRLPSLVGHGRARELALTARVFSGKEACEMGLVAGTATSREGVLRLARGVARGIAAKSPLAVVGTKHILLRSRDRPHVEEGLDYVATWNAAMVLSTDLQESLAARAEKRPPVYARL